jgi:hypothetical protein
VGALHLSVAKTEIAGMDPGTFVGILISLLAVFLSFFTPARWVKRLLRVAAGIALLEFVLLAVSMAIWVRVVIGLVLCAVSVAWVACASRNELPTDATDPGHAEQIRAVLDSVATALKDGSPSNLTESDAAIIKSHFPKLAKHATVWDGAANEVADSKRKLRASVEGELRDLHAYEPPYEFEGMCDRLCAITEARTADRAASTQPFPPMIGHASEKPTFTFFYDDKAQVVFLAFNAVTGVTGDLVRLEGDSYPDGAAHEIDERYGKPIYDLLRDMQTWNPTKMLTLRRHELEAFASADLERTIKKERDKTYYRRAQGCPGCN